MSESSYYRLGDSNLSLNSVDMPGRRPIKFVEMKDISVALEIEQAILDNGADMTTCSSRTD